MLQTLRPLAGLGRPMPPRALVRRGRGASAGRVGPGRGRFVVRPAALSIPSQSFRNRMVRCNDGERRTAVRIHGNGVRKAPLADRRRRVSVRGQACGSLRMTARACPEPTTRRSEARQAEGSEGRGAAGRRRRRTRRGRKKAQKDEARQAEGRGRQKAQKDEARGAAGRRLISESAQVSIRRVDVSRPS